MEIVWDERKRRANLEKHGLDFAALSLDFFLTSLVRPAKQNRMQAIGRIEDACIVVIFVPLGSEALSLISMRPASHEERKLLP
ncbi:BrnT family toxin [Arvimicrobium flavum]|uniref:BrnT family toxin n=1 Tax=Arvimicrobium flavum TaxID=3393320 RepID=UPI00237B5485|nr:BrnT family toxin [Mesorhizobium shangrilense]